MFQPLDRWSGKRTTCMESEFSRVSITYHIYAISLTLLNFRKCSVIITERSWWLYWVFPKAVTWSSPTTGCFGSTKVFFLLQTLLLQVLFFSCDSVQECFLFNNNIVKTGTCHNRIQFRLVDVHSILPAGGVSTTPHCLSLSIGAWISSARIFFH